MARLEFRDNIAEILLQAGAKDSAGNAEVTNPLFDALNDPARLKELIRRGADVNGTDTYGWTPLWNALNYGHLEAAKVLIEGGADVKTQRYLTFPINDEPAAIEVIKMMLDRGADINSTREGGRTVLMDAVEWRRLKVVRFLIRQGARLDLRDSDNKTAFDLAKDRGYDDVAEMLKSAKSK